MKLNPDPTAPVYARRETTTDRRDVVFLAHGIADDLCQRLGREDALEYASERCMRSGLTYWQRANWRFIRRLIDTRVQSPHPGDR